MDLSYVNLFNDLRPVKQGFYARPPIQPKPNELIA